MRDEFSRNEMEGNPEDRNDEVDFGSDKFRQEMI